MNLSTADFIRFYSEAVHPRASQISPILVSPFTSTEDSLQIQVIQKPKLESKIEQDIFPSYKIIKDDKCFYQISSQNQMTLVQKIYNNRCMWKIPTFFPAKFVTASLGRDLLFVGLSNKTISILDTNTGVCCFPSIFVEDRITFLVSEENYLICLTSNYFLMVWEIANNKCLKSIIHEKYEGPKLGDIQKIILTNELENDSISPIIFAENITVRFSKTRNGWINANCKIPSIFTKTPYFRTIHDVEKGFFESLINDEIDEFHNCMQILLQKYLKSKHNNRVIKLANQLLDIIREGKTIYCGMNPKELLEFMLNVIGETNTEVVDVIRNSQEYNDAFNPKPHPPSVAEESREVHQQSLPQPNNSNISQEQQEVIDLIYKSQPTIITQPNESIPESEKQDETFVWPIPNAQNQTLAKKSETIIQEQQTQLNENAKATNEAIITSPNTLKEPSDEIETESESKVKSYNEDDGLTRTQKLVSESLPQPPIFYKIPSPPRNDKTKKNASPAGIPALNIVMSDAQQSPTQKTSISSPSKQPKKKGTKQATLTDFLSISPKKSEQKKPETQVIEEKKTKSTPKKKAVASQKIQQAFTQQEPNEAEQSEDKEQEVQTQQQSIKQRRSPRASRKASIDNSPEPKKKTTKTTKKKKATKAKNKVNEDEQQQEQQDQKEEEQKEVVNDQQEIQEAQTPKKTTRKSTPKKTPKIIPQRNINPFQSEDDSSTPIGSQQLATVSQPSDVGSQFAQPAASSEVPTPFLFNKANQLAQQQTKSPILQQKLNITDIPTNSPQISQAPLQQQQINANFQNSPELQVLLNDPKFQSSSDFKKLPQQIKSLIVEYQKQHNIKTKRNTRAKNLSQQQPQVEPIQPQIQEQQQQSAEVNNLPILTPMININDTESEETEKKKATPKRKASTPRKTKAGQKKQQKEEGQQQSEPQIEIPQEEFIASIESNKNEQENDTNSLTANKTKAVKRGRKAKAKESEDGADNNQKDQKQAKKKSTGRQRKKKDEKSVSQAPLLQFSNNDEKLSAPTIMEHNKLTIEEAHELAEKMQEENQ